MIKDVVFVATNLGVFKWIGCGNLYISLKKSNLYMQKCKHQINNLIIPEW